MADVSLSEIIAAVRFRGDMRNTIRFPDANLTTEIQAAWSELYELIVGTNEGYFDTDAVVSTTAGIGFISVTAGQFSGSAAVWRLRGVDRLDGTDYINMPQIGITARNSFSSTTGVPIAFRPTARGIDLYPTPNAVFTLRITYTPIVPFLLDDGGPAMQYYNGWEEYVIYGALVRLTLNQDRTANDWDKQLAFQRDRIVRGASGRKSQEPDYLPLRENCFDSEFDRDQRWR